MTDDKLKSWLAVERTELKNAVKEAVRLHVEKLKNQHKDFYGYSIMPGEPYEVNGLIAASNRESNIKDNDAYYRYSVDEWQDWDNDALDSVTPLIAKLNEEFRSLHPSDPDRFLMDEFEISHIASFHIAFLGALRELVSENVFNLETGKIFIVIWIPDSDHEIILKSVRELNSEDDIKAFMGEFG